MFAFLFILLRYFTELFCCVSCSISLSSLESEVDDPFSESTANLLGAAETGKRRTSNRTRTSRTGGTSSTHSLNEADLQVNFCFNFLYNI